MPFIGTVWSRCSRSTQNWYSPGASPVSAPFSHPVTIITLGSIVFAAGVGAVAQKAGRLEIGPVSVKAKPSMIFLNIGSVHHG